MADSYGLSSSSSTPSGGAIGITLLPYVQANYPVTGGTGVRLRIEACNGDGINDAIFRYYQKPANATTGEIASVLSGVCTWVDMVNLPETAPDVDGATAEFRLTYVDIVVDTIELANSALEVIVADTQALIDAVALGQTLEAADPITLTS